MTKTYKQMLAKPAIHAGVSAIGISVMAGEKSNFIYGNRTIPVYQLGAGLGAASSFAVETISNFILPHIPGDAKMKHLESLVLHVAGSGATFALAAYLLNPNLNMNEAKQFFAVGAIAETVSSYVYENVIVNEIL